MYLRLLFLICLCLGSIYGQEKLEQIGPNEQARSYLLFQKKQLRLYLHAAKDYCFRASFLNIENENLALVFKSSYLKKLKDNIVINEGFYNDEATASVTKNMTKVKTRKYFETEFRSCVRSIARVCELYALNKLDTKFDGAYACETQTMLKEVKTALSDSLQTKNKFKGALTSTLQAVEGSSTDKKDTSSIGQSVLTGEKSATSSASLNLDPTLTKEELKQKDLNEALVMEREILKDLEAKQAEIKKRLAGSEGRVQKSIQKNSLGNKKTKELIAKQSKILKKLAGVEGEAAAKKRSIKNIEQKLGIDSLADDFNNNDFDINLKKIRQEKLRILSENLEYLNTKIDKLNEKIKKKGRQNSQTLLNLVDVYYQEKSRYEKELEDLADDSSKKVQLEQ
ncbi:hypothetical protein N9O57_00835 [bacterium]|nr:hypothetical protein [bacterium]